MIYCGKTDECDGGGCWRIVDGYRVIESKTGKILGFRRIFKFSEMFVKEKVCRKQLGL